MARNVVQFQKGLSEPAFEQQYGTEEQCRAIVVAARWPHGFECRHAVASNIVWWRPAISISAPSAAGRHPRLRGPSLPRRICRCGHGFVRSITCLCGGPVFKCESSRVVDSPVPYEDAWALAGASNLWRAIAAALPPEGGRTRAWQGHGHGWAGSDHPRVSPGPDRL